MLFQKGVEEQQIMSITGHRSYNAVRVYKEISHEQEEETSKIIQREKRVKVDNAAEEIEIPCLAKPEILKVVCEAKEFQNNPPIFNFNSCNVVFHNH